MRRLLVLLLLVLLVFAGYAAWWWQAAERARAAFDAWAADLRARGGAVDHAGLEIGGFPASLTARATAITVRLPQGPVWQGPAVIARAAPWDVTEIAFSLPGQHRVTLPAEGLRPELELAAESGEGTASFALGEGFREGRLTLTGATLAPGGREADPVRAERVQLGASLPVGADPASLLVSLETEAMQLPSWIETPLGREIEQVRADAQVVGPLPVPPRPETLESWSQAGGHVEIGSARLGWGPLDVAATGRLTLDADFRPAGRLDAEIVGLPETLDALAAAGLMRENDATLAKVAVGFLSRQQNAAGAPVVDAPVALRDGWLSLGPVRLLPLPPLVR